MHQVEKSLRRQSVRILTLGTSPLRGGACHCAEPRNLRANTTQQVALETDVKPKTKLAPLRRALREPNWLPLNDKFGYVQ